MQSEILFWHWRAELVGSLGVCDRFAWVVTREFVTLITDSAAREEGISTDLTISQPTLLLGVCNVQFVHCARKT